MAFHGEPSTDIRCASIRYSDYEMRNQIGFLDITGSGTWFEKEEERIIYDTDEDGKQTMRKERCRHTHRCRHTDRHRHTDRRAGCKTQPRSTAAERVAWSARMQVPLHRLQDTGLQVQVRGVQHADAHHVQEVGRQLLEGLEAQLHGRQRLRPQHAHVQGSDKISHDLT